MATPACLMATPGRRPRAGTGPRWSPEEERALRRMAAESGPGEIATALGRSYWSVTSYAHRLGIEFLARPAHPNGAPAIRPHDPRCHGSVLATYDDDRSPICWCLSCGWTAPRQAGRPDGRRGG